MARTLLIIIALALFAGCSSHSDYIKIKGSETVLPISLDLAEKFTDDPELTDVSVTAGGSGVGIAALLQANTDIAMASRAMKFHERVQFAEKGYDFVEFTVGLDALALIINKDNPIDSISLEQAKDIYQGKITNWKELGGPDKEIVALNRESSSGTYGFFQKKVLKKEDFAKMQTVGANGELVEKVAGNTQAIGYVGIAYVNPAVVKPLKVYNDKLGKSILPNIQNSLNKSYPLVRPLFFYYLVKDEDKVAPVIDFLKTQEGQILVKNAGYPPNPEYYKP